MKIRLVAICIGLLACLGASAQTELTNDSIVQNDSIQYAIIKSATVQGDTILMQIGDSTIIYDFPAIRMLAEADSVRASQTYRERAISSLFLPIVFNGQKSTPHQELEAEKTEESPIALSVNTSWLQKIARANQLRNMVQNHVVVNRPELVRYNQKNMPEVPQQFIIESDPVKQILIIKDKPVVMTNNVAVQEVKVKRWILGFQSTVQFSQLYISDNWYQGGTSNLSLLSDQQFSIKYNDPKDKRILFENLFQWRLNLNSAPEDTLHSIRVSEDLFQINSKFGLKAANNWYYSATLNFKTQFLTSYEVNSYKKTASFLSPGELNVGLGMSYQYKNDKKRFDTSISLSPLSYNLQFLINKEMDPKAFGINEGWCNNLVGSSFEGRIKWEFVRNMVWTSRLFYFTNYTRVQADFENTIDFILNRFFSTKLFVHVRFDDSRDLDPTFKHFQLRELLSFGFNYKF